ncbi:MAG: ATPase, T2SS/T4P/T4SS family, partial [Gammaproteobacteria bacterium]|nr:ATPase, T2SS/T4P/T4SS family [Gammaproteobacteria bacterium]
MDFDSLLKLMVHKNASDLFITAGVAPSLKINGKITPVTQATLTPKQAREIVYSIMSQEQRRQFDNTCESNFAISASGIGRFRVSAFQQRNHAGMVLRKIETTIPTIEDLHLPPILKDFVMTKRGLVIMVGATGSGKSTSLAAMIGYRNKNSSGHIISIEDPIEFIHHHEGCIV